MGACFSCCTNCCAYFKDNGMWGGCCPCLASRMTFKKFMIVVPWLAILALVLFLLAFIFLINGLDMVTSTVGIDFDPVIDYITLGTGAVLMLLNVLFAYSVGSNKLRLHKLHCAPKGCAGYHIMKAENCCSCLLRLICKIYGSILSSLSVVAILLALVVVTCFIAPLSGALLFLIGLCQEEIFLPTIQVILDEMQVLHAKHSTNPVADFVSIANGTLAEDICEKKYDMYRGTMFMMFSGPVIVLAQIIMLITHHVVGQVAWRQLKVEERMLNPENDLGAGDYNASAEMSDGRPRLPDFGAPGGGFGDSARSGGAGYDGRPNFKRQMTSENI